MGSRAVDEEAGHPHGLFASLKSLLATFADLVHTRIDLFGTEVEEQVARLTALLVWSIVTLFLVFTAVVLSAVAVIIAFWDEHRVLVAVGLAGLFAALAALALWALLAQARARPRLFQATLAELAKDRDRLGGQ